MFPPSFMDEDEEEIPNVKGNFMLADLPPTMKVMEAPNEKRPSIFVLQTKHGKSSKDPIYGCPPSSTAISDDIETMVILTL